jgi:hypothetical protein
MNYKNLSYENLLRWFVILLPFDSFPFPIEFVYRPLAILPIILVFFIGNKSKIYVSKFLLIGLIFVLFTSLLNSIYIGESNGFKKFIIEIIIILVSVSSLQKILIHLNLEKIKNIVKKSTRIVLLLFVIVGILQFISRYANPFNFMDYLNSIFTYRFDNNRIQFFSGEPSMGVRTVIFYIGLAISLNDFSKNKFKIIILFILILVSGSTFGLLFLLLFIIILLIIRYGKNLFFRKETWSFFLLFIIIIFLLPYITKLLPQYAQNKISYIPSILNSLSFDQIINIASLDGSFFLRVFNPIIGFQVFIENFLFGIGGENFQYYYIQVIENKYRYALGYPTIQSVSQGLISITPKSLIIKVAAEFGIIGLIYFCVGLLKVLNLKEKNFLWVKVFVLALIINYDSYIFLPLIFGLLFLKRINTTSSLKSLES